MQKYHNRNGRCIAMLFKSIGVRVDLTLLSFGVPRWHERRRNKGKKTKKLRKKKKPKIKQKPPRFCGGHFWQPFLTIKPGIFKDSGHFVAHQLGYSHKFIQEAKWGVLEGVFCKMYASLGCGALSAKCTAGHNILGYSLLPWA